VSAERLVTILNVFVAGNGSGGGSCAEAFITDRAVRVA
jgi:hypothetical protein